MTWPRTQERVSSSLQPLGVERSTEYALFSERIFRSPRLGPQIYHDVGYKKSLYVINSNSPLDQYRAVTHRIVRTVPDPQIQTVTFRNFLKTMNVIKRQLGKVDRWTHQQVIDSYCCGRLARRYVAASKSLIAEPLCKNDATIRAFVKLEKFPEAKLETSAPRLICSRSPRYILETSTYLKPIDKKIRFLQSRRSRHKAIVKGLNQTQRCEHLKRKCNRFSDYVIISLDAKKFDAHVSLRQLEEEHAVYNYCHDYNKELQQLLRYQLRSKGSTKNVRFKCEGRRMSGDPNTSLGNNMLMFAMCVSVLEELKIKEYELHIDGDDVLIILNRLDETKFTSRADALFTNLGHEMECGGVWYHYRDAVHCQTKIFGNRMIRHYEAVLGKMFISDRHFYDMKHGRKVLKTIAQCELALNRGVPVIQACCVALLERLKHETFFEGLNVEGSKYRAINEMGSFEAVKLASAEEITDFDRAEFELSFGLEIERQIMLEQEIVASIMKLDLN